MSESQLRSMRAIVAVLVLALSTLSLQAEDRGTGKVTISAEHRTCHQDSDCTVFSLECSCDCGEPINSKFLGEYLTIKADRCKTYSSTLCKMKCPGPEAVLCTEGRCVVRNSVAGYDTEVSYQIDVPITFPDIVVTYKDAVVEPGHEKVSSQVFEIARGTETKQVTIPLLSMSGTLVRFGFSFYRLHVRQGHRTLLVKKGMW